MQHRALGQPFGLWALLESRIKHERCGQIRDDPVSCVLMPRCCSGRPPSKLLQTFLFSRAAAGRGLSPADKGIRAFSALPQPDVEVREADDLAALHWNMLARAERAIYSLKLHYLGAHFARRCRKRIMIPCPLRWPPLSVLGLWEWCSCQRSLRQPSRKLLPDSLSPPEA